LPHNGPFSFADQARDALDLLKRLDVERAHLVGHSFGGCIALEMALQRPPAVRSLVLLDAAPLGGDAADARARVAPIANRYLSGDARGAVDTFLSMVGGQDWEVRTSELIPGAADQAVRDAATFFEIELPAIATWQFNRQLAQRITQPVLHVSGSESGPASAERRQLIHSWIAQTEDLDVRANHMLHMHSREAAAQVAEGIAAFLGRHAAPKRKQ
jgi:pimeloyl-ACP methyl ester carboxylesterase